MVKAAGFEARIVQPRVRNLNASANYFRGTQSHIKLIKILHRFRVRFPALPDFLSSSESETDYTQPREFN